MTVLIYGIPVYLAVATLAFVVAARISVHSVAIRHYVEMRLTGVVLGLATFYLTKYVQPSFYRIMHGNAVISLMKPFLPEFLLGVSFLVISLTVNSSKTENVFMQLSIGAFWSVCLFPFWVLCQSTLNFAQ